MKIGIMSGCKENVIIIYFLFNKHMYGNVIIMYVCTYITCIISHYKSSAGIRI